MNYEFVSRLRKAVWLTLIAAVTAFPYLFTQSVGAWSETIRDDWGAGGDAGSVFVFQFALLLALVFLCSLIGAALSDRYNLPTQTKPRDLLKFTYRYGLFALIGGFILGWFLHDRLFYTIAPAKTNIDLYSRTVVGGLWLLLYASVMKEIIFRYGFVTLAAGVFRGKHNVTAAIIVSVFGAVLSTRELEFIRYPDMDMWVLTCVLWSFISNLASSIAYVKKGLWAAIIIRAFMDFRFILYPLFGLTQSIINNYAQ